MRAWEGETIARAIEQKSAPFSGLALDILAHLHLNRSTEDWHSEVLL
jgi:hypothetical protein